MQMIQILQRGEVKLQSGLSMKPQHSDEKGMAPYMQRVDSFTRYDR